jgi:hypothetical protein
VVGPSGRRFPHFGRWRTNRTPLAKEGVDGTAMKLLRLVLKGELTLEQVERT